MEQGSERRRGWDDEHGAYACADSVDIAVQNGLPGNGIVYRPRARDGCPLRLLASATEFDRDASLLARTSDAIRTVIFPRTARKVLDRAFQNTPVRSAVLNEGLEELGECRNWNEEGYDGVFNGARLQRIVLPPTLRVLGDSTFRNCQDLGRVIAQTEGDGDGPREQCRGEAVFPAALEKTG